MAGRRMSARSHVTLWAHDGGVGEDVTVSHFGAPDRLENGLVREADFFVKRVLGLT